MMAYINKLKKYCRMTIPGERMIMKSGLNAKSKITAIGALAVPVLRCSFGIINWRSEEIRKIDRKTRRILTKYKMHHPRADTDKMYKKGKKEEEACYELK
jgi:hypothetical protein